MSGFDINLQIVGNPNAVTASGWFEAGGHHALPSATETLILIDLGQNFYPHTVLVSGREALEQWVSARLTGFDAFFDQNRPTLIHSGRPRFNSPTLKLCGTMTLTGSYSFQVFHLACEAIIHGRYLGIRFRGPSAVVARVGVFTHINELVQPMAAFL